MIEDNRKYYEYSLGVMRSLLSYGLIEDCIHYIEKMASYCWWNFPGVYYSKEMESILNEIGTNLSSFNPALLQAKNHNVRNILHICSELYVTGGHTKLLYNWISLDQINKHAILSTRMAEEDLKKVNDKYTSEDVKLLVLKQNTFLGKVAQIKNVLYNNYDFIILHVHPDEVLANLVFSDPNIRTPIMYLNHADHTFWLGNSIADALIQIRVPNVVLDKERRQIDKNFYLPIPIEFPKNEPVQSEDISKPSFNILSIGSQIKYEPNESGNFYEAILRIVEKYNWVEVSVVGIDKNYELALKYQHERISYLGQMPYSKLDQYRRNCDLYLEGFPMPSFTALLETAAFSKPFVLHFDAKPVYQIFEENKSDYLFYPRDISEWQSLVERMINDQAFRGLVTKKQFDFVSKNFSVEMWKSRLASLYLDMESVVHSTKKINIQTIFNGPSEHIVANFGNLQFNHLEHTAGLDFLTKIRIASTSKRNMKNLYRTSLKEYMIYFLPASVKRMLKIVFKR